MNLCLKYVVEWGTVVQVESHNPTENLPRFSPYNVSVCECRFVNRSVRAESCARVSELGRFYFTCILSWALRGCIEAEPHVSLSVFNFSRFQKGSCNTGFL